jgi:hypothetical protein
MRAFENLYREAEDRQDDISILLGNGFSIAADQAFNYRRLLDRAQFSTRRSQQSRIRNLFDKLDTADFELVVQRLDAAVDILGLYDPGSSASPKMERDRRVVRDSLAETLAEIHPKRISDIGDGRLDTCHDFLADFDRVFTLNYDLLLYWAINRKQRAHFRDGFRRPEDRLVYTEPGDQTVSWLHGAIHLHEELIPGDWPVAVKQEWSDEMPLVDQVCEDIKAGQAPLIVMEGTWQQKQIKINSSLYLSECLALLRRLRGTLFTYGWSMSSNDIHICSAIQNSRISHLYVGLHGGEGQGSNPSTVGQANTLSAATGGRISLEFWDTASADTW